MCGANTRVCQPCPRYPGRGALLVVLTLRPAFLLPADNNAFPGCLPALCSVDSIGCPLSYCEHSIAPGTSLATKVARFLERSIVTLVGGTPTKTAKRCLLRDLITATPRCIKHYETSQGYPECSGGLHNISVFSHQLVISKISRQRRKSSFRCMLED